MARPVTFRLPEKNVTEIRVHGVGGTPPDDMLDDPHPVQVSGDHHAGFYRQATERHPRRHVEAYSWGGLTSRNAARSLWLLLLPFTLANVGGWMVEIDKTRPRAKRQWHAEIQERIVRVFSVLLTVNFVAWIAAMTVALVAHQCGSEPSCRAGHWWLKPLEREVFDMRPQLRVFVGVAFALLVYALVDFLAKRVRSAYDEYPREVALRAEGAGTRHARKEAGDQANLESEVFWNRPSLVRDLARLHRACVMLTMLSVTALTLAPLETGAMKTSFDVVAWLGGIGAVLVAAWAGALRWRRKKEEGEEGARLSKVPNFMILALVTALVGMFAAVVLDDPPTTELPTYLVHFRRLPILLLLVQIALVVVLVLAQLYWWGRQLWTWSQTDRDQRAGANLRGVLSVAALLVLSVMFLWTRDLWVAVAAAALGAVVLATTGRWRMLLITGVITALTLIPGLKGVWEPAVIGLAALIATWWALATENDWRPNAFRWGPVAILPLLGSLLLSGVMVGVAIRLGDFLDKERNTDALRALVVPPAYEWFSLAFAGALVLTALAGLVLWKQISWDVGKERIPFPRWKQAEAPQVATSLDGVYEKDAVKAVRSSRAVVKTARAGDILLTWLCSISLIIFLFGVFVAAERGPAAGRVTLPVVSGWDWLEDRVTEFVRLFSDNYPFIAEWDWLRTSASWLLALLPLAVVYALRRGTQDESVRRKIGIVWDLGTFWPRRFHPLAPPSYSERAVPELQQRMDHALLNESGRVALLAHSQGTVVAIAALAPLAKRRAPELKRLSLVTYGSPLRTFYERFFPTYFSPELFDLVGAQIATNSKPGSGGWKNFYRWTDPIAAPIFTEGFNDPTTPGSTSQVAPVVEDEPLYDPWWWWDVPGQALPAPYVHSNYLEDPHMRRWVVNLWPPP